MAYCDRCGRGFRDNRALEQHKQDSSYHWICHDCGLDFSIFTGLDQHYKQSPKHHYCRECNTDHQSEELRLRHMEDNHWYCRLHDRVSVSPVIDSARLLRQIVTHTIGLQIQSRPPIPLLSELRPLLLSRLRLHESQCHLFGLAYIPFFVLHAHPADSDWFFLAAIRYLRGASRTRSCRAPFVHRLQPFLPERVQPPPPPQLKGASTGRRALPRPRLQQIIRLARRAPSPL